MTPVSLEERLMHIKEAKRTLGSRFDWICDSMENELKLAMGGAPNSEWVIDPEGIIVRRRDWSNADELRKDLTELIGPTEEPTRVEDLDLPAAPPLATAASGVVERLEREEGMRALKVDHTKSKENEPFYAKLRAEGSSGMIEEGGGRLYLRFMMDPLYKVYWNNKVDPIKVRIETPEKITVTPSTLTGSTVTSADSDIDPREFLVDVSGVEEGESITLKAYYFACTDLWCRPMTQEYVVNFELDRDGGSVISNDMHRRMDRMKK